MYNASGMKQADGNLLTLKMSLKSAFNDFLIDRDVCGVRPATIDFYKREIRTFFKSTTGSDLKEVTEITPDKLRAYFISLRDRRSQNGIHKNFTALRTWILWMWNEYDLQSICPITKVKVGSPVIKPQPAMDMETFKLLLGACRGDAEDRDRAILFFLLDTGVRRMELCRLKIANLNNAGIVQLDSDGSKTGEPRKLFLVKLTQKNLLKYLKTRQNLAPEDPLFATITGEPLSAWGLCSLMARLCKRAGVPSQGMHKFRRGFALESLRSGADLVSISRMLGHKKVETTKRYLPQTDDDLVLVHQHTSPINQLRR